MCIRDRCYNCQRYGHSSAFCHHPTRCLRCGDSHRKDTCPLARAAATCANCGEPHPASSKSCKFYAAALMKLSKSSQQRVLAPPTRPPTSRPAASAAPIPAAAPALAPAPARPASTGAPSYAAAAASQPAAQPAAQQPKPAAPSKKKTKPSPPASCLLYTSRCV